MRYTLIFVHLFSESVQFSRSVMSDSLQPHGRQHARLPCPSPSPGVCSNSCPVMPSNCLILCCRLLLLPSIIPSHRVFSKESVLRIRWPKYWSFSYQPFQWIFGWFLVGLTGLISLLRDSWDFSSTTIRKHLSLYCTLILINHLIPEYLLWG